MNNQVQQWEYIFESDTGGMSSYKIEGVKYGSLIDYLNAKGALGWELVQAPTYQYDRYIFKRPLNLKAE